MAGKTRILAALALSVAFATSAYAQRSAGGSLGDGGASVGASVGGVDAGASIGGGDGVDAGASIGDRTGIGGSADTSAGGSGGRSVSAGLGGSAGSVGGDVGASAATGSSDTEGGSATGSSDTGAGGADSGSGGIDTAATDPFGTATAPSRVGPSSAPTPDLNGDRRFTIEDLAFLTEEQRARILAHLPRKKFRRLVRSCRGIDRNSALRPACDYVASFPR